MRRDAEQSRRPRFDLFIASVIFLCLINWCAAASADWVARYNDPANAEDIPTAMALDRNGNIYVTGYVIAPANGVDDIVTVKYDHNGNFQWEAFYNGPANMSDEPVGMAVDRNGNVYVTGWSEGGSSTVDFVTIKYDTFGNQKWAVRYNEPGSTGNYPGAIAVDGSGNVFVTGSSDSKEAINSSALVTIKYDTNGNPQWVKHYNGPANGQNGGTAISVDRGGNVYVAGFSSGTSSGLDFVTIKYATYGSQKWVRRYNGPANGDDAAQAIAIDSAGNVCATGYSFGADANRDFTTIKYDTNGRRQWVKRYYGPAEADNYPTAITVDPSANVYVTGSSHATASSWDYATVKYTADGLTQWVRGYNGPANSDEGATAIAVDGSANVYVTGGSKGGASSSDFATIKYDAGGRKVWVKRYTGPGNGWSAAQSLAVDRSGNVFVTGLSCQQGTWGCDFAIIRYDANPARSFSGGVPGEGAGEPGSTSSQSEWNLN